MSTDVKATGFQLREGPNGIKLPIYMENQATTPVDRAARFNLSEREIEVLRLIAAGQTDREIAETLFISPRTANVHVANLRGKLGVSSRAAAVALAHRHGLV